MEYMVRKKLYTAEIRQFGASPEIAEIHKDPVNGAGQYGELISSLARIEAHLGIANGAGTANGGEVAESKAVAELAMLRQELQSLSDVIHETRREIASLSSSRNGQKLDSVADQLGAVVSDTEAATNIILEAVEIIENKNESLERHVSTPEDTECVEAISQSVMRIYEACNFQDVTGQRISKVVETLGFVDERITRMIDILGGEDELQDLEVVEFVPQFDEDVELSGPRPEGHEISQDEIDSLFD